MNTVRFSVNPANGYYVCSEPGEQAGEYVPADTARALAGALAGFVAEFEYDESTRVTVLVNAAHAALSAAGWPEGGEG